MSNANPKMCVCDSCGTEHQIEGQWEITDFYRYRIHYKSSNSIGPATEMKVVEARSLKEAKEYAKRRAVELGGRLVEIYRLEETT